MSYRDRSSRQEGYRGPFTADQKLTDRSFKETSSSTKVCRGPSGGAPTDFHGSLRPGELLAEAQSAFEGPSLMTYLTRIAPLALVLASLRRTPLDRPPPEHRVVIEFIE